MAPSLATPEALTLPALQGERTGKPDFGSVDFNQAPFIVIWEVTRACDLRCVHCRAEAIVQRHPLELTFKEGCKLIDQIREFGKPLFVITGGDPLKRPDIYDLIKYGDQKGLRVALTPSGTQLMQPPVIKKFKTSGLSRLAVSLDGSCKEIHDTFRKVDGSFDWTVESIKEARRNDIPVQINTTVCKHNLKDVRAIGELLATLDICLWSVFFLVPTGRGLRSDIISAREHEDVFHLLYDLSKTMPYDIKTTAAQHYRRVVVQRRRQEVAELVAQGKSPEEAARIVQLNSVPKAIPGANYEPGGWRRDEAPGPQSGASAMGSEAKGAPPRATGEDAAALKAKIDRMRAGGAPEFVIAKLEAQLYAAQGKGADGSSAPIEFLTRQDTARADAALDIGRAAKGVNDGNGFVFIDHIGLVYPSGFLPFVVGDVRKQSLVEIYRESPIMKQLRDYPTLKGKCSWCDFRDICGGSRSRSFGVTGDFLASEPYCSYFPQKPKGWKPG
ncbi:MAG TPA: radical SAM protein [Planctomycetota bacterium]|nr:radical SAM protein [Planctomycetota bacterium]